MRVVLSLILSFLVLANLLILKAEALDMNSDSLTQRQKDIISISAYTANGQIENLKSSLNEALDAGLTINEIKEILVQLYAYAGFPRCLNGIHAFMVVLEDRKAKGLIDQQGKMPTPMPENWNRDEYGAKVRAKLSGLDKIPAPSGYQLFTPVIDKFLKEHLFADIFSRDNLGHLERELTTIAALASIPGLESQLQFHMGAAMNVGMTASQMKEFIAVLEHKLGKEEAKTADAVLNKVLAARKK